MIYFTYIHREILLTGLLVFFLGVSSAEAAVSGVCSNCHTMHDSQGLDDMREGAALATGLGTTDCKDCHAQLRGILIRFDCIGCHAQGMATGDNIVDNIPQVAHNTGNPDLAGGNFFHIFTGDDINGHNVHGFDDDFLGPDANHGTTPPGYDAAFDPSSGGFSPPVSPGQVMCAGQNGCHGNRDEVSQNLAIKGAHHANDSSLQYGPTFNEGLQGGEVGTSFRYLYKVKGAEDSDWEAVPANNDHNEYIGAAYDSGRVSQNWAQIKSMSSFCAECHGEYHSGPGLQEVATPNVWIRHPTDAVMPSEAPFTSYSTYDPVAPVARPSIALATGSASSSVTAGSDIVFCLSCHRSHASPYPSMLRWDYETCFNESPQSADCGCFTCHSTY